MLLHYLKEEDAFACVMHLLRGSDYLQQSTVSVLASGRTLLALIKKHKSVVYHVLKKCAGIADDKDLVKLFMKWQNWIFEYLPLSHVVRVVDCFLFEGHKLLLRVGVALVYIWSKSKTRQDAAFLEKSPEERLAILSSQFIETFRTCPVSVQTLLDVAVGIRNLKGATVAKYQKAFEDIVREEEASKINGSDSATPVSPSKISGYVYAKPFRSCIIDSINANALMCSFPGRLQFDTPQLLFRTSSGGISFTNFWAKIEHAEQTLIIILTSKKDVFGAFCSAPWSERKYRHSKSRYFGTGESFVWRLDRNTNTPVVYQWVGQNSEHPDQCPQYFMTADDRSLIIGGGNGDAISIRDELCKGLTSYCSTFNSPALTDERDFTISELEVFSVQSSPA
uniref:TLDc domain-containing protein n=1 Tax=Syphacia muris TaxID=451379 RepID=A0A0N5ABQ3_9BILA